MPRQKPQERPQERPQGRAGAITDRAYWDGVWAGAGTFRPIDPAAPGPRNYVNRALHAVFTRTIRENPPPGPHFIEIGCGASRWLAYFHQQFGFAVSGLDYSAEGCASAQRLLTTLAVPGEVFRADMFDPPEALIGRFDILWSNGLVEHFADTATACEACATFLRPGGLMITLVPNMTGPLGRLQKCFNPALYAKHVPLDKAMLARAHAQAGLTILSCDYALPAHLGVLHLGRIERLLGARPAQALKIALTLPIRLGLALLRRGPNRITSPYLICVARKPAA